MKIKTIIWFAALAAGCTSGTGTPGVPLVGPTGPTGTAAPLVAQASPVMTMPQASSSPSGFGTEPVVELAPDNPKWDDDNHDGDNILLMKFIVRAKDNGQSMESVRLDKYDLDEVLVNATIANLAVYPLEHDNERSYGSFGTGVTLGDTVEPRIHTINQKWSFVANATGNINQIPSGQNRTFILRGDVKGGTVTSSFQLFGTPDKPGQLTWSEMRGDTVIRPNINWTPQDNHSVTSFLRF